jgi:hypothetical protein
MRHHQSAEFLAYQVWRRAAQGDLDFPTFATQRPQFLGRRLVGRENARHQPMDRLSASGILVPFGGEKQGRADGSAVLANSEGTIL